MYKDSFDSWRLNSNEFNIKVQFPYYDMYLKEFDEDLRNTIKDFSRTFLTKDIKVKNAIRYKGINSRVYWHDVIKETEINSHKVNRIEERSTEFVLDHIIPISYGFKHGISPNIIGNDNNLQILTNLENLAKSNRITEQVKEKLKEFNLQDVKPIEIHEYNYELIHYKVNSIMYKQRLDDGLIIKYFTKEMELLQTDLL